MTDSSAAIRNNPDEPAPGPIPSGEHATLAGAPWRWASAPPSGAPTIGGADRGARDQAPAAAGQPRGAASASAPPVGPEQERRQTTERVPAGPDAGRRGAEAGGPIGDPGVTGGRRNQEGTNQSVGTWEKEPIIEMVDVHKAFGSFKVLDGVTFRIPKDGVTVLMGPSGTGKSVSLRHIVGLLMPDKGDIIVSGRHVPRLREKEILELRRKIGMLFQDGALFSSMSLYDNVAFPLRQHTKYSESKVREVVMQRLSEVGLAGAEKRMPNELSGGMRKRAGFARALVMEPEILLFDEPDSGLDPVRTTLLCDLIREISAKYNATSIVISHDVNGVRRMADYIGILYKGKMRHFGTKEEIENSPDEFVKQFFNAESDGPLGMD